MAVSLITPRRNVKFVTHQCVLIGNATRACMGEPGRRLIEAGRAGERFAVRSYVGL